MSSLTQVLEFLESPCTIPGHEERSWREWMGDILVTLNKEIENFSGKRPNCNSGWWEVLSAAMARKIDGRIVTQWDDEGFPEKIDVQLQQEVFEQIVFAFGAKPS